MSENPNGIVIIGCGLAGYGVAREFRKLDSDSALTLISTDDAASYYKPNLSKAFTSQKQPDELIQANAADMAEKLSATILGNTKVLGIDSESRTLSTSSGQLRYRELVLATGANPIQLPIAGNAADQTLSINSLDDYRNFRNRLPANGRILIMGAGLIGCEFANDLAANSISVTVVDPSPAPLGQLLPEPASAALEQALTKLGVKFHFNAHVTSIDATDSSALNARLSSGELIEADIVLSAVGLRPDLTLAEQSGLSSNRGILVDRQLRTSNSHIFAVGDACEIEGLVLPFVAPITHASKALAAVLAGQDASLNYPAMPVIVKTPACPTIIAASADHDHWQVEGDDQNLVCRSLNQAGNMVGFVLTGSCISQRMTLARELPPLLT